MLLELEGLTVRYGRREALSNVSVSLESKALGLLGPNGAGKSTLIRTLLGLVDPTSGSARLEDKDIVRQGKHIREMIGYMPEHESHITGMTPIRWLRYLGEICGLDPLAAMERAHEVLFYVGLGEVRYRKLDGFSYGMQQKTRLAQALIHGPKILVLDEPTNGLDPTAREEMLALIREMIETSDAKIIISSHLLHDIESCCEDVLVLKRGKVVASGNIEGMKRTDHQLFEIKVKGEVNGLMADLSQRDCECRLGERDVVQVTTPAGWDTREIFAIAQKRGIQIRHFYNKKDTLEDIFIKVMEDEAPQDAPEAEGMKNARL